MFSALAYCANTYLIRFAPLAFVHHRLARPSRAPSPLVVPLGLSDFTPTRGVPSTFSASKVCSISSRPAVELSDLTGDLQIRLRTL